MSTFEFDSAYSALSGKYIPGQYVPDVLNDPDNDVWVGGAGVEWHAITGKTGQYSYRGAVMHPSETADDETVRAWVIEAGGDVFAIVEVREDDGSYPDGDPIGWAVIYQDADASREEA